MNITDIGPLIVFYPKSQAFIAFSVGRAAGKGGYSDILAEVQEGKGGQKE